MTQALCGSVTENSAAAATSSGFSINSRSAALGGAGALLSQYIISAQVVAYEDLGTEAIRKLELKDFPAIVAYDSFGNTVFKKVKE